MANPRTANNFNISWTSCSHTALEKLNLNTLLSINGKSCKKLGNYIPRFNRNILKGYIYLS